MGRYKRQLPLIDKKGQKTLRKSSVLIVGLGGIGSPVALYLAGVGVGSIGLCDFDKVEMSNLNRQILYKEDNIGQQKIDIARTRLSEFNSRISFPTYPRITKANCKEIITHFQIIADCSGDYDTHYFLNEECKREGKTLVYAGAGGYSGNIMTITRDSACLNCIFPKGENKRRRCQFGPVNGIIGALQAGEIIKQILGSGDNLVNKLLRFDFLSNRIEIINIEKDKQCNG